jgi:hypothetical protein
VTVEGKNVKVNDDPLDRVHGVVGLTRGGSR